MRATKPPRVFDTDRRIRLGIWGLGRGTSFLRTCQAVNIDVVAGCDFNEVLRARFKRDCPDALVTADAEEFLKADFDAVLLATFCPDHAPDTIRCLQAGKHVLSEVTAFHTPAEGVQLVEAVERSGLVYNLAENYPFSAANMYLARRWREGLFGDLLYAEMEYLHECRPLQYTYLDGTPIEPGNRVHAWRSWLHSHYYCTHSLGVVMNITGTRPVRVVSLPAGVQIAGYLRDAARSMGSMAPQLIQMSNGGLVRNLMGASTGDGHVQRLWGTRASAEQNVGAPLRLRLGAAGNGPQVEVRPAWEALGEWAEKTGHGGGDFWVLYYFARQILTGEKAPFDVYSACDVTLPGILAYRSAMENGRPYEVPDFRDPAVREQWRRDDAAQERYDPAAVFPADADPDLTGQFTRTARSLISYTMLCRAAMDGAAVQAEMTSPGVAYGWLSQLSDAVGPLRETYARARRIVDAYPQSDGAKALRELLETGEEAVVMSSDFPARLRGLLRQARRRARLGPAVYPILVAEASPVLPLRSTIERAPRPPRGTAFRPVEYSSVWHYLDLGAAHGHQTGVIYVRAMAHAGHAGRGRLLCRLAGPFRLWVNGRSTRCEGGRAPVQWRAGQNEILLAVRTGEAGPDTLRLEVGVE